MAACEVLVVGAGLAGLVAAIEAARAGARVTLACAGALCSGSSFYAGTWGLGCIGPEGPGDESELAATILSVGRGMAGPALVETLVEGIEPAMAWLEGLGVALARPASEQSALETAYIPCFDHKARTWRGLTRGPLERALRGELERLGVEVRERMELIDLVEAPSAGEAARRVAGAVLHDARFGALEEVGCGAVVLACGGTSGLFERRLTAPDVPGSAQGIALAHGCALVNVEFVQLMPALVAPRRGIVFNEKTFRYLDAAALSTAAPGLPAGKALTALLEERSGHGPFTARLSDHAVDLAIDAAGEEGLPVRHAFPARDVSEFVQVFSTWMEGELGIAPGAELRLALFAHASNGGIAIDSEGRTDLPGLFACGEVSGGMHGADRLGGLSSANCLVFGRAAGRAAALWAQEAGGSGEGPTATRAGGGEALRALRASIPGTSAAAARSVEDALRHLMGTHCMVRRDAAGLACARAGLEELERSLGPASAPEAPPAERLVRSGGVECPAGEGGAACEGDAALARTAGLRARLLTARAMVAAMEARRESRGAHFRADAPIEDPAQARPAAVRLVDGAPAVSGAVGAQSVSVSLG